MTQPQHTQAGEREAFEEWYTQNAFDFERNPIGSRECGQQWKAWQARAVLASGQGVASAEPSENEIFQAWVTFSQRQRIGAPRIGEFVLKMLNHYAAPQPSAGAKPQQSEASISAECQHDLRAEYEGAGGARAAICAKCHERVQTTAPTAFSWDAAFDGSDAHLLPSEPSASAQRAKAIYDCSTAACQCDACQIERGEAGPFNDAEGSNRATHAPSAAPAALTDEHKKYSGWMLMSYPPLDASAFHAARGNMGTTTAEQDGALYRAILAYLAATPAAQASAEVDIKALVNRFLTWPVPASVYPDGIPGRPGRTGTNLLSALEAEEMLRYVLAQRDGGEGKAE